jgi:hypothetical protein
MPVSRAVWFSYLSCDCLKTSILSNGTQKLPNRIGCTNDKVPCNEVHWHPMLENVALTSPFYARIRAFWVEEDTVIVDCITDIA